MPRSGPIGVGRRRWFRTGTAIALAALVGSIAVAGLAAYPSHSSSVTVRTAGTSFHASVAVTIWGPPALHYVTTGAWGPSFAESGNSFLAPSGSTGTTAPFAGAASPSGTLGITGSNAMLMHCAKMFKP